MRREGGGSFDFGGKGFFSSWSGGDIESPREDEIAPLIPTRFPTKLPDELEEDRRSRTLTHRSWPFALISSTNARRCGDCKSLEVPT